MSNGEKALIMQMARYHGWATERLLAAVASVPEAAYREHCGLFFGSIHNSLNHLLLTDSEIWYPRFAGGVQTGLALDAELEPDRARLSARLYASTMRWAPYVEGLSDVVLAGDLQYVMTTGVSRSLPMGPALLHVFNHGTHHRGQITAALSAMGVDYPPLDLPYLMFGL